MIKSNWFIRNGSKLVVINYPVWIISLTLSNIFVAIILLLESLIEGGIVIYDTFVSNDYWLDIDKYYTRSYYDKIKSLNNE